MDLRPYQKRAIEQLREKIRGGTRAVLLVLPTGGGKTVVANAVVARHIAGGGRVLFLAHRTELVKQAARTFVRSGITSIRVIRGQHVSGDPNASVTIASIPTLATARWVDSLPPATLVIFDEAHHTKASSWERIASAYRESILIGLTATPERADGKPLGDIYKAIVVVSTVRELTDLGFLVPCAVFAPDEYRSTLAEDPVDAYINRASGKRAIVFCPTVVHARDVAERLNARGVPAACVDGKIGETERAAHLQRFAAGELRVVTNVAVLTEGFDDTGVEVCILARACDHAGLYLQIIGRVIRAAPGKTDALLIDLRGTVHRHGLPDDDREYALEGDAIRLSSKTDLPPLKQCKKCGYCGRTWRECPACGYVQSDPKPPEVRRAELKQVFAQHDDEQRRAYWQRLREMARERGYHPNWCTHRFSARYGVRPDPNWMRGAA